MTREEKLERAGEYALGLLEGDELASFEAELARDPELAAMAMKLATGLHALDDTAAGTADPAMWGRIEQRIGSIAQLPPKPANENRSRRSPLWAAMAASVAVALAVGYFAGQSFQPQPTMVAVLINETDQSPGAIIEAFGDNTVHVVPLDQFEVPEGRVLQVWTLPDPETGPVSLGTLEVARDAHLRGPVLPMPENGQLYEITLEPAPGSPTGRPTGPILVKGFAKPPV